MREDLQIATISARFFIVVYFSRHYNNVLTSPDFMFARFACELRARPLFTLPTKRKIKQKIALPTIFLIFEQPTDDDDASLLADFVVQARARMEADAAPCRKGKKLHCFEVEACYMSDNKAGFAELTVSGTM